MKKTVFFSLLVFLIACDNENEKSSSEKLQIDVIVDSPFQKDVFQEGTYIGCFLLGENGNVYEDCPCNLNIPAFLIGENWHLSETKITSPGNVLAYYPYKNGVDINSIPIETVSQTDYLYSEKAGFSTIKSKAILKMKHILSLVRFNLLNIPETVKAVRFNDVCVSAGLDLYRVSFSNQIIKNETYEVYDPEKIAVMAFPRNKGNIQVSFLTETKEYTYHVEESWPQGKEITYNISFDAERNTLLSVGSVTIREWEVEGNYELN